MKDQKAKFEIGQIYLMTFISNSHLKVAFKCINRTKAFVTLKDINSNEVLRRKIKLSNEIEYILQGSYSMSPSIYANDKI